MPSYHVTIKDSKLEHVIRDWVTEADTPDTAMRNAVTFVMRERGNKDLHHGAVRENPPAEGAREHELYFFTSDGHGNPIPQYGGKVTFRPGP